MQIPVLLLVFNRPDKTQLLIEHLSSIKPQKIYIGADGPRNHEEKKETDRTRQILEEEIDWPCIVEKLYRDENLGCRKAVSGAISWFFEQEKWGVILEDDCLPNRSFFQYCESLLAHYESDDRIMHISGHNLFPKENYDKSYYFSIYPNVWGWATWRSAWSKYNDSLDLYEKALKEKKIKSYYTRGLDRAFWQLIIEKMLLPDSKMRRSSWAYYWSMSIRFNNGLCITPARNLVKNVGFDPDATNTTEEGRFAKRVRRLPVEEIEFPLSHPDNIAPDDKSDDVFMKKQLIDSPRKRVKMEVKRLFPFLKPVS